MDKVKTLGTVEEIKAYADPYRLEILAEFKLLGKPATVKQVADKMNEVPAKIYYHVKKLEKAGILVLDHTEEINGIVAKYYKPVAQDFAINNKEVNDSSRKVFRNEVAKTIQRIYRTSEKIFIGEIQSSRKDSEDSSDHSKGEVTCKDVLYATEEEIEKMNAIISEFVSSHEKESTKQGVNKYHFFSSIIQLTEKEK